MKQGAKTHRMTMVLESTIGDDYGPTGSIRVVDLRPATICERAVAWIRSRFTKPEPDVANVAGLSLPFGTPVSVGIELSPETYTKLVNGNTKVTQAIDLLRDTPVSMSLIVAPASMPAPSIEEMQETVV